MMRCTVLGMAFALLASPAANAALVIAKAPTRNVDCAGGVCTATAADAVLNIRDVKKFLKAGDLKIASGSAAEDIAFNATLTWTKSTRLTLDAYRSIDFTWPVTAEGPGAVTLITNDGGSGGDYTFTDKGKIAFWDLSSSLIINGTSFTLVGDIHTLASDIAANPSGAFALARGYDASVDGIYSTAPVPTVFKGYFDGLGHAIVNLSIKELIIDVNVGLFAEIDAALLRDIRLSHVNVSSNGSTGALVGRNSNGGVITRISVDGTVLGVEAGGIVGTNYGVITDSNANVAALGTDIGGLVGYSVGTISRCHSQGSVSKGVDTGGLVGYSQDNITDSSSAASVVGFDGPTGGLVGVLIDGTISRSFSTGSVAWDPGFSPRPSSFQFGGLVGGSAGTIIQSYATGSVIVPRTKRVSGGLVGWNFNQGTISQSYSLGLVKRGHPHTGGLIGKDNGNRSGTDYWDMDTSRIKDPSRGAGYPTNDPGIIGLTDAQLKSGLPSGFDPAVWGQSTSINNGYPYLLANPPPE